MTAVAWQPRLRTEVTITDGGLRQPRTGAIVKVGPVTRALLPRLDGQTPLQATGDEEDALRALLLLGFVEGSGDANLARLLSLDTESPPLTFLEESRFTCHGSGQCCRTYVLGPIEEEDVRRLARLDIASAFPALGDRPYLQQDDMGRYYLARKDEHCVFLQDDARCGIHAKFGVEAKPKLCRLYPWRAQLTLAGLRIVDTAECSTFARSVKDGEPLREQLERILPLLPAKHEIHHPLVLLDRGHPCDYGWILALEEDLLGFVESGLDPARLLLGLGGRAFAFADALARCPLARGEPDATVAAFLARPLAIPGVPPRSTEGDAALQAVARALEEAISAKGLSQPVIPRFVKALRAAVAGEGPPIADVEHVSAVLRASLASAIFGGRLLCEGHLRAGVLRLALVPLLALAWARTGDLSEGHLVANVALRMPSLAAALVSVEEHAPAVLAAVSARLREATGSSPSSRA